MMPPRPIQHRFVFSAAAASALMLSEATGAQALTLMAETADVVTSIEAITPAHAQNISRLAGPVCLKVITQDKAFAHDVANRFVEEAKHLQLKIDTPNCTPNIEIAVSPDHARVLRQLLNRHGAMMNVSSTKLNMSLVQRAKILVWSNPSALDPTPSDNHYISIRIANHEFRDVDAQGGEASLIARKTRDRQAIILILDASLIEEHNAAQVADYAAMRLLGQTTDQLPQVQSILRVFQPERPAPEGLTAFDHMYLDQLYAAPANLSVADFIHKISPIALQVAQPLISAPRAASRATGDIDDTIEAAMETTTAPTEASATPPSQTHAPDQNPSLVTSDWTKDIVVVGHKEGPAMWRVRKGNEVITILGTVAPLPQALAWQDWRVKAAIRRSRLVLINSEPEANLIWMRSWSPDAAASLYQRKGHSIADDVSPDLQKRLGMLAEAAGQNVARYTVLRPGAAAILLNADWRDHSGYTNAGLGRALATYARKNHIPVQYIRQISLLPTIDEFPGMPMASQINCLDRIMTGIENERSMANLQAADWATGNIGSLRQHYLAPANCAADIRVDEQRRRSAAGSWASLLLKALERNETRTFAMIDISSLLRQDGVLMQLRQAGATIDIPPDEAE